MDKTHAQQAVAPFNITSHILKIPDITQLAKTFQYPYLYDTNMRPIKDGRMTCNCMSFSKVFQSSPDDGQVIMKCHVQWNLAYG